MQNLNACYFLHFLRVQKKVTSIKSTMFSSELCLLLLFIVSAVIYLRVIAHTSLRHTRFMSDYGVTAADSRSGRVRKTKVRQARIRQRTQYV